MHRRRLDALSIEAQIVWVENGGRGRGGGSNHGSVIGAQLGRRDDELRPEPLALPFQPLTQGGVGGHTPDDHEGRGVVKLRRTQELARERLDDGGLVTRGEVRQLLPYLVLVQRLQLGEEAGLEAGETEVEVALLFEGDGEIVT